ncbi:MAG: DUF1538 domain-containing protein [Campylobacterales bacterium]
MSENKSIRYGDFLKEVSVNHVHLSYNDLAPKEGAKPQQKIKLRSIDIYRLLTPYVSVRFFEQLKAVAPLALYMVLFQIFILRQPVADAAIIGIGLGAVIVGLMFFMEGLKQGLMPFGESIGNTLPKKVGLTTVLLIAFLLGIGVTFAEPAIGALKAAGSLVKPEKAPYLYALLNDYSGALVLCVGVGVGVAAVVGTMRFLYGWGLKPLIYMTVIPSLAMSAYFNMNEYLAPILGLAWDCGGVTTGPVTVPLVLALGIGIASAAGKGDSSLSGFGIVTLASVFPVMAVMFLGLYVYFSVTPQEIVAAAATTAIAAGHIAKPWYSTSPYEEMVLGVRAIVPLVIFLMLIMKVLLKEKIKNAGTITYGIVLAVLGMMIFNVGLTYGLSKLGGQSGSLIPAAFHTIETQNGVLEALYPYFAGITAAIFFAFVLGFGATLAEPALNALGLTVQNLTNGVFKKSALMYSVSVGVALGITVGVLKIIYEIPLTYLLLPSYAVGLALTYFSTEEFVNIAWDSAGVTTGPITVPLVLAMGLGFGNALNAVDGFGILAMASICPIIAVLAMGIYARFSAGEFSAEPETITAEGK